MCHQMIFFKHPHWKNHFVKILLTLIMEYAREENLSVFLQYVTWTIEEKKLIHVCG